MFIKKTTIKHILLTICITLVVNVGFQLLFPVQEYFLGEKGYPFDAHFMLEKGEFGSENHKTWNTPGYPLFIALIFLIFGEYPLIVLLFQAVLGGVNAVLVYLIGKENWNVNIGFLGGLITGLYPTLILYRQLVLTEVLFITFLLATFLMLSVGLNKEKILNFVLAGILGGICCYVRPIFIAFPFFVFSMFVVPRFRNKKIFIGVILFFVISIGLTIPWNIRNHYVADAGRYFSSKGDYNFLMGNNPEATGTNIRTDGIGVPLDEEYVEYYFNADEGTRGKETIKKGLTFIAGNPLKWVKLCLVKISYLWNIESRDFFWYFTQGKWKTNSLVFLLILLLFTSMPFVLLSITAIIGLFLKNYSSGVVFFILFLIYTTLIAVIFIGASKYHVPSIPILALFSASYLYNRRTVKLFKLRRLAASVLICLFLIGIGFQCYNLTRMYSNFRQNAEKFDPDELLLGD